MDDVGLATLWDEMKKDCEVAATAYALAVARIEEPGPAGLESCAHYLTRLFNIIEQMSLRVAKAFENHIDDEKGWHADLIRRMNLSISGVRPALFPHEIAQELHELRMFRHVFNHAYDLRLDPDKLRLLLKYAGTVAPQLAGRARTFVEAVASMHSLTPPPP